MKIAIVGSRNLKVENLEDFLPPETREIVSGGARGIDTYAEHYAKKKGLRLTVFYPDYEQFGKRAPLLRNHDIVNYADEVFAFWDGVSRGTAYTIEQAKKSGKPVHVFIFDGQRYKEAFSTLTLF